MADTKDLTTRTQGKVIQLDYDFITSLEGQCSYCLTDSEVQMILGMADYLGWSTRWYSTSGTIDQQTINNLQGGLLKKLMNPCCGDESPIRYRYLSDGTLQKSTDDGATWEDAPEFDPRNNSTVFPPLEEGSPGADKCDAANGMTTLIKEQVGNQLTDDMTRYTLGQLITDWINTILQTSNPFTALLTIVANQIFALIISAVIPALTDDVYNDLTCIFIDHMNEDLSFDEDGWNGVRSDISSIIGGIGGVFLEHLVYLLGQVGLTNLARSQVSTDADCDCGTCDIDNWVTVFGTENSRNDESIFVTAIYPPGDPNRHTQIGNEETTGCYVNVSSTPIPVAINWWNEGNYPPAAPDNTTDFNYGKTHLVAFVDAVYGGGGSGAMNFDLSGEPIP